MEHGYPPLGRRRGALAALVTSLALLAVLAQSAAAQPVQKPLPLLPLARGHLLVSIGTPPDWMPLSGQPQTLTLFSGRARAKHAATLTAFIALQRRTLACAAVPARDHATLRAIPDYYSSANLLSDQTSPFAPTGGAAAGDYQAQIGNVVIAQHGAVRVCVWLARSRRSRGLAADTVVPLLNTTFAASASALPTYDGATLTSPGAYTVNAIDGGSPITERAVTANCTQTQRDTQTTSAATSLTEVVSLPQTACAADGTTFTFTTGAKRTLGRILYTVADAEQSPPAVVAVGGCELDPVAGTSISVAAAYVVADGCRVGRILVSPYASGIETGAVEGASVDGGDASLAPLGTTVDLVVNGTP